MTIEDSDGKDFTTAWVALGKGEKLVQKEIHLKSWDDDTVELQVTHCGLCGTDKHVLNEDWGPTNFSPGCVAGHEITGIVTKVGKNVSHLKVGDRAGSGVISFSCLQCSACVSSHENVCHAGVTMAFNSQWPNGDMTYGGFAEKWRGDYRFIQKIPKELSNEDAASLFCAGGSVYSPMVRWGVKPGSVVGVLGLGGLGHFAVLFGKAMGATLVVLSRGESKRTDSMKLGSDDFVNIDNPEDMKRIHKKITHIICTGYSKDFAWKPFISTLKENGVFILVAGPGYDLPPVSPGLFIYNQVSFAGSIGSSPIELERMLEFAAKHKIKPWIKKYDMENINEAIEDFDLGLARFRFILENKV